MSRSTVPNRHESPFATLDAAFRLLSAGPSPPCVDGRAIGGDMPPQPVPLQELRSRLLDRGCGQTTRNAAIAAVLQRAQDEGGGWLVGVAGLLLPGLSAAAKPLIRACPDKAADVEAEMLAGLVTAARAAPAGRDGIAAHLVWAARRAAEHVVRHELAERARPGLPLVESAAPPRPYGHPDLVLAEAVTFGVVDADDADLVGATRLGEMSLQQAADDRGISYRAAVMRRRRAEQTLTRWLGGGVCDRRVTATPARPVSSGAGRPRHGRSSDRRPCVESEPVDDRR